MNKHLSDGKLRAAQDGELSPAERQHLEGCTSCQSRQSALQAHSRKVARRLAFLDPSPEDPSPEPRIALAKLNRRIQVRKESPTMKRVFASPILRYGAAIVLILALILAIPTTRGLAAQLLSLFRVQQVAVVPVDMTGMQRLAGNESFGMQISDLLSKSVTMTKKPGEPIAAASAEQATNLTGFTVRLPQGLMPSQISVETGAAFTFKVDRAKAQALLDEAGRSDLILPSSIDGAEISVDIPAGVTVSYGTCPEPSGDEPGFGVNGSGPMGRRYPDCVMLAEIPSPTVKAPAEIDVAQLAQLGLEFTGMSAEQAAAFTKTVDWTSSLVVPIPKNAATYEQVQVDGVTGTLIQRPADDAPQFALLWVKGGIIYAIGGLGSNSQQALQMANSLP
jgi:anti-sigma factor RsiW